MRPTDARLLADARRDPDAFRALYDRYARRIHAFFERRTGDREASLDLTAETFSKAWLARHTFRDLAGGSAGPWLFAIARRTLLASVEKRRLEHAARLRLGLMTEREAAEEEAPVWLEALADALAGLPPAQRQAVELRVVEDLSYEQVAAGLGCSPTAARIRVSRGLSGLRQALEGETP
ncbi:MAG TPA: RNA polymerase sigma factor [Gaiellaceae bacterium]